MKIVVDTREQMPFQFYMFECRAVSGTIPTGDYSLAGLTDRCAVERKSLDDLMGCLVGEGRERFERVLARARGLDAFAVVAEKNKAYNIATPEAMAEKRQKAIDHVQNYVMSFSHSGGKK